MDAGTIENTIPGIKMLMSWIPALIALLAAVLMTIYPLTQSKLDEITATLENRRLQENV
jgi:GPH family glycoside/pentoside/hexuronide:cation symporter